MLERGQEKVVISLLVSLYYTLGHTGLLRAYSQFCTQRSLMERLRRSYGIKPKSAVCKYEELDPQQYLSGPKLFLVLIQKERETAVLCM